MEETTEGTLVTPKFEIGDKVHIIEKRAVKTLGLEEDTYTVQAIQTINCTVDDGNEHCKEYCRFRSRCRNGENLIFQLIAVEDVLKFYDASYFEKAQ